jgi:hypothetical protein
MLTVETSPNFIEAADIGLGAGLGWLPNLDLQFDGDQMQVIWPNRFSGFTLQGTTSLPGGWKNLASGTNYATFGNTNAVRFFRLAQ